MNRSGSVLAVYKEQMLVFVESAAHLVTYAREKNKGIILIDPDTAEVTPIPVKERKKEKNLSACLFSDLDLLRVGGSLSWFTMNRSTVHLWADFLLGRADTFSAFTLCDTDWRIFRRFCATSALCRGGRFFQDRR